MAFAVYGMAVVVAPAIGPTLGGWITDNFSWRWIFYINVPIGILSLFLTHRLVEDPPYLMPNGRAGRVRMDYMGLGLLVLAVGCLQMVLDKGQENDWFGTHLDRGNSGRRRLFIRIVDHLGMASSRSDRRISACSSTAILPPPCFSPSCWDRAVRHHRGDSAVSAVAARDTRPSFRARRWRAAVLIMLLMMPIAGILVSRVDPRFMMAFGFWSTAASLYYIATHLSLQMDFRTAFLLRTYQAMGLAFIFLPSNTLAYVGMPREKNNQISAMNSFVRNIGGSIGIALISTAITRQAQVHQNYMVAHAVSGNRAFDRLAGALRQSMLHRNQPQPLKEAYGRVMGLIQGQATTLAYIDVISIMAIAVFLLPPFILFMRRPKAAGTPAAIH